MNNENMNTNNKNKTQEGLNTMKTTVNTKDLKEAISFLKDLTNNKKTYLPALQCIKISRLGISQQARIEASNLDETAGYNIDTDIVSDNAFIIDLKQIENILKSIKDDKITFQHAKNEAGETIARIEASIAAFELLQQEAQSFPIYNIERYDIFCSVETQELIEKLDLVDYCADEKQTRKALNGVLFELTDNNLSVVGCDGKRLSCYNIKTVCWGLNRDVKQFVLSLPAIKLIKKIKAQDITLFFDEKKVTVKALDNSVEFESRLIEGNYPNYKQVIPATFENSLRVKASELFDKVKVLKDLNKVQEAYLNMILEPGKLSLLTESKTVGRVENYIDLDIDLECKQVFCFDIGYLFETLKSFKNNLIELSFTSNISPVNFKPAGCNSPGLIIMPMKPQNS